MGADDGDDGDDGSSIYAVVIGNVTTGILLGNGVMSKTLDTAEVSPRTPRTRKSSSTTLLTFVTTTYDAVHVVSIC